jgi:leucyl aminopeptidase
MNFQLSSLGALSTPHSVAAALWIWVGDALVDLPEHLLPLVQGALDSGDLERKAGEVLLIHRPAGLGVKQLVLLCAQGSAADQRRALAAAAVGLKGSKIQALTVVFSEQPSNALFSLTLQGISEHSYTYTHTKPSAKPLPLQSVMLCVPVPDTASQAFDREIAIIKGVALAKEWGNRPANHATPEHLAQAALALAKKSRVKCEVLDEKDVAELKMGALLAVAKGSAQPLRFVQLRYQGAAKAQAPVVLIGKGITFDSGGISIKPAAEMDEMKFDMCGAASVLGVFQALSVLKPSVNVVGLIPACENLPSSHALKPGDVVTSMSGQTIEVLNTDAEGRLILSDALTFAQRFKPKAVIDIATLTGACVIALGAVRSGLFSNDAALAHALMQAGESAQDLCWPMPLDDDYADGLKTQFADVANVAGRPAGAVTAAKFLQRFAGDLTWAHLDIAGTAWKSGTAKGATGRPVGLLVHYLLGLGAPAG